MADGKTREEREREWWDRWWETDYSWAGLAAMHIDGDGGPNGEKTLQDYWRRDPVTGVVRDDAAMEAAGEFDLCDGRRFHIVHLPACGKSGSETWKASLADERWGRLDEIIALRVQAGAEATFDKEEWWRVKGRDSRAQLTGAVLRGGIAHPGGKDTALFLQCEQMATLGWANWANRSFGLGTGFTGSIFLKGASFFQATFSGDVQFSGTIFSEFAGFYEVTFKNSVEFFSALFCEFANFRKSKFAAQASFHGVKFFGVTHFGEAEFSGDAHFNGTAFSKLSWFSRSSFMKDAYFSGAEFEDEVGFWDARFEGSAIFQGGRCANEVRFRRVHFGKDADFSTRTFDGLVYFDGATFAGPMDFYAAIFDKLASFKGIHWPQSPRDWHAAFDQTLFRSAALFRGAHFADKTYRDRGFGALAAFDGAALERGIDIDDPGEAIADRIFEFEHKATAAAARVDAKEWAERANSNPGAKAKSRGEIAVKTQERHEIHLKELERGCRVLKQAMELASNKTREQMFYRYELMARRSQRDTPAWERFFSALYEGASHYGGSIGRPLTVLIVGSVLFGVLYWLWYRGFSLPAVNDVQAILAAPLSRAAWAPLIEGLTLSASRIFPFGPWDVEASALRNALLGDGSTLGSFMFRLTATFQSLSGLLLAFLSALAVRRRFQIS